MSDETVVEDTPDEVAEVSMDDTIRNTLAEIEARGSEEETEEQKADRLRDERGRFAKPEATPEQPPDETPPVEEAQPAPESPPAVPPELQRLGLRKDEAEAFAQAPEAVKNAFIRRSEEMHKGLEQFRTKAQFGDVMERVVTPYLPTIQALGVTPDVAVNELLKADQALRFGSAQQKFAMISKIAQDYGVDLGQATEFQASQPQIDPQVQMLQRQLQQQQQWIQQQTQAREWQERQELNSHLERFKSDPSHAYFEDVRNDMAGLLQAGLATDLNDAYEKAIYANPTVRTQVLAKQQAEFEEKRKAEALQKAQAAKQAASANVSRKATLPAAKPVGSIDDTIRETAQRLGLI